MNDIEKISNMLKESESKIFDLEAELRDYQNSQIVGVAIKVRAIARTILKFRRNLANNVKLMARRLAIGIIPQRLRRPIKYVLQLRWLIKKQSIINAKYSKTKPLVTVVIPYFNHGITIEETLGSLQNQTFTDFEVFLVNDGSTIQQSIDILKRLKFPKLNLTIINQKNKGVAVARNNGISRARGKYIVCLDADDTLVETYLEKNLLSLETNPDIDISETDMRLFGVKNLIYKQSEYNPFELLDNNMLVHAAMFKKDGWREVGGYKPNIGYEDWEFWISLAENGYWGKRIPEALFNYRTAVSSRYIDDQTRHKENLRTIKSLHRGYIEKIKKIRRYKYFNKKYFTLDSMMVNLREKSSYLPSDNNHPNILITIPWMTFGGAETLIYNYCREIKDQYNITFMTGIKSEHEWEYKFKEITNRIYHLDNLFENKDIYLEFISNYIVTRKIDILHIIHNGFTFEMLPKLKARHPKLKVLVTMFNDKVEYFQQSVNYSKYVDIYVSDNQKVAASYKKQVGKSTEVVVVPNGINCYDEFSEGLFDRDKERANLGLSGDDTAVFFVGRFSSEKNPDVFLHVAEQLVSNDSNKKLKFFMVGDGVMRHAIEEQISSFGSDKIKYLGYQSEVARYLSTGDIFVLPSSIEGFPLSILEAMAMKLAVIASDVGAVSDVINDEYDGFVVRPGSSSDISKTILKLYNDKKLLDNIKIAARLKLEKKYSNTILKNNYLRLYKDALK